VKLTPFWAIELGSYFQSIVEALCELRYTLSVKYPVQAVGIETGQNRRETTLH
jgi:hypothetical protein